MDLKPLHDWAVIRPSDAQEMTAGGLYIPDAAKEKPREGVVEAIGPGALEQEKYGKKKDEKKERRFIPTTIKPGDLVLYEQYAGQSYTVGTTELVLVRERDILGILSGPLASAARPLQIPASTATSGTKALVPQGAGIKSAPAEKATASKIKEAGKKKTTAKKPAKKK